MFSSNLQKGSSSDEADLKRTTSHKTTDEDKQNKKKCHQTTYLEENKTNSHQNHKLQNPTSLKTSLSTEKSSNFLHSAHPDIK